ncbi:MAG: ATP-binding protein [Lachnospiraceae bacterium]
MLLLWEVLLLIDGIIAFYYGTRIFYNYNYKNRIVRLFCFTAAFSGLWSLGFGLLYITNSDTYDTYFRVIGMAGVIMCIATSQILIGNIANLKKTAERIIIGIGAVEILMFVYLAQGNESSLVRGIFILLIVFTYMFVTLSTLRKSNPKSIKHFCRYFLLLGGFILVSVILDVMILKAGYTRIFPVSCIVQFVGVMVLYRICHAMKRTQLSVSNISNYVYSSLQIPVLILNQDMQLEILNDSAAVFLKVSREDVKNEKYTITDLFDIKDQDLSDIEKNNKSIDAACKLNDIYCSISVAKLFDEYGDLMGYFLVVKDLTERMKIYQILEQAREEAEAANEAKSLFLANMSHEIRTPMNAIVGFAELAMKENMSMMAKEYIQDIRNSSAVLLSVINDILDISRIESGKMELVCSEYSLMMIIKDLYVVTKMQCRKNGLEMKLDIDPTLPGKLYGDQTRIHEILNNLLGNAVKYTKEGSITLKVISHAVSEEEAEIEVRVIDTGIGLKPEEKNTIFESFTRTNLKANCNTEGTGLGLAITKGYIDLMGGDLSVESEYGKGSVFIAKFKQKIIDKNPVSVDLDGTNDSMKDYAIGNMKLRNVEFLVVDDNMINLKVISKGLEHYGVRVDVASSGKAAIERCQKKEYNIVFMDQMMPEMDGVEAMHIIRDTIPYYRQGGASKIVVLTANVVSGIRVKLIKEGFDEYIGKPINYTLLEKLFEKLLPEEVIYYEEMDVLKNILPDNSMNGDIERKSLGDVFTYLDWKTGMKYCGGKESDYVEIVAAFVEGGYDQLKDLKEYEASGEYENFTILAHALKGLCLNIGANSWAEPAKELELAGKREDYEYIKENAGVFYNQFSALLNLLKDGLKSYDGTKYTEEYFNKNTSQTDQEIFEEMLVHLKECIDTYDFAGGSVIIQKGKKSISDEELLEKINKMEALFQDFDLEGLQEYFLL